jgi:TRAP-type mannitol/chloroaromatic compound transport system permease small subunit
MLQRIEGFASRMLGLIAGASLFAMMLLTFVDVIGRYGFHRSIFGAAEIIEQLMMLTVFAGLAFITAKNEHITVTLMEGLIVGRIDLLKSRKRTAVLDLPQWHLPMSAAILSLIGFGLLVIAVVRKRGRLGATSTHGD